MDLSEFTIGGEVLCGGPRDRCTNIGSRVVAAIRVDEATIIRVAKGRGAGDANPRPSRRRG